jgi:hypothetical protein
MEKIDIIMPKPTQPADLEEGEPGDLNRYNERYWKIKG